MDSSLAATWIKRVEIDTRAPFRSVREAVSLFGDRVLAAEVFPPKLKPHDDHDEDGVNVHGGSRSSAAGGDITAELEETKQSLEKAKEEGLLMASSISSLKEELERTKLELYHLKAIDYSSSSPSSVEVKHSTDDVNLADPDINGGRVEFQKKRYVTFANPPSVAQVMVPETEREAAVLQRHPSLKKKKKKQLIPLIGGIFSRIKKAGDSEVVSRHYNRLQVTPPRVRK